MVLTNQSVIPAKAGISIVAARPWEIPAFAGMTFEAWEGEAAV